jgi:tetratricopeptide (TPR) repeat protein
MAQRHANPPLSPILEAIGRASEGSLIVLNNASPACMGSLVQALLPDHPTLGVQVDVHALSLVPEASTQLFCPAPDASGWFEALRGHCASRRLRVVLWLSPEAAEALDATLASELRDLPGHPCPPQPAIHGIAGLHAGAHGPGVEWLGGPLAPALEEAHPERAIRWISASQPYDDLLEAVAEAGEDWACWTEVDGQFTLCRLRWALAEQGRWGRSVLVEPEISSPGWWPAHSELGSLPEAIARLSEAGAARPGLLAALAMLEPEAIDLVEVLLATEAPEAEIQAVMTDAEDPGAALAQLGRSRGLFTADDVVNRLVAPPIQRACGADENVRTLRAERFEKLGEQVLASEDIPMDLLGSWATTTGLAIPVKVLDWSTGKATAWLVEAALRHGPESAEDWRAIADAAIRLGDAHVGARWADKALTFTEVDEITRSRALYTRARADYRLGAYAASEERLRVALEIQERLLGPDHHEVARTLHAIGGALNRLERYAQALAIYNRARDIEQRNLEPNHPDMAVTLHAIGQVMVHLNRYEEALRAFQQALAIKEEKLGPEHPSTASTLHAIGQALTRQGKYKEALESFQRDLRITRKQLGKDHPSLGPSLHSIGQTYTLMGRHEYALACFAREIKILERALGKDHPDTTQALDAMGQVLTDIGQLELAVSRYKKALRIKLANLGEEHRDTARTLYALGHTYVRQGELEEALDAFERTVDIRRATVGKDHPYTALAWHALGQTYARMRGYRQAIGSYDQALSIKTKVLGPDHPETAITRFERGRALRDAGDSGGLTEMMAATGALVRELGAEHPMVKAAKRALS